MAKKTNNTKNSFKPVLVDGTDFFEISSSFQKSVRRGLTEDALHFAQSLFFSNKYNYVWKRLATCAFEDIGLGDFHLSQTIASLYKTYLELMLKKDSKGKSLGWL
jgi:replication-associated recombination protein RarA